MYVFSAKVAQRGKKRAKILFPHRLILASISKISRFNDIDIGVLLYFAFYL